MSTPTPAAASPLLEIRDLKTWFHLDEGTIKALNGATFDVRRGETLCIVGESGCGKSMTARSILQIVQSPGKVEGGEMVFHRQDRKTGTTTPIDLAKLDPKGKEIRSIRGKEISMIFQEPMTSLSPIHTIGDQIAENVLLHTKMSKSEARLHTIDMLKKVGIPRAEERFDAYPFQLSGGLRQRAMIAMALANNPSLLIADEPTTALDVTTQAQIIELMQGLQDEFGMAMIFITHDLGVVAEIADEVAVMYLGQVVERGTVDEIFHEPKHPVHPRPVALDPAPRPGQPGTARLDPGHGARFVSPANRLLVQHPMRPRDTGCLRQGAAADHGAGRPARRALPALRTRVPRHAAIATHSCRHRSGGNDPGSPQWPSRLTPPAVRHRTPIRPRRWLR